MGERTVSRSGRDLYGLSGVMYRSSPKFRSEFDAATMGTAAATPARGPVTPEFDSAASAAKPPTEKQRKAVLLGSEDSDTLGG